jgi:hypothetical protein
VDARIGAPRPVKFEVLATGDRSDSAIDLSLDGSCVLLNLPAAESCAGIFDSQLEAGHPGILNRQYRRLEAGGWRLEAGDWRLEAGGWRLGTGGWGLEAGAWRLEAGIWNARL